MTESLIPVQGTGKNLETSELVNAAGTVHREGVFIGDPTDVTARAAVDVRNKAVVVMDSEHYRIHQGEGYTASGKLTVAQAGGQGFILIDNTNGTYPHFRGYSITSTGAPVDVYLYESPTTTANGTQISARNNNRNSVNTSVVDVYSGPTVSANGTELEYFLLVGTKQSGGSGVDLPVEWILKPATKYLIRIVNNTVGAGTDSVGVHIFWYEAN